MRTFLYSVIILSGFTISATAQSSDSTNSVPPNWFLSDPTQDHLQGVSADRVYSSLLKGQPSKTVIVAVVDSGIDINHEDLKDIIWTNEGEIPGNGIDDDHNGYIDDVHGWNFLGNKNGENVEQDTYGITREYIRLKKKFETPDSAKLAKKQKVEFKQYKAIKTKFLKLKTKNAELYGEYLSMYLYIDTLRQALHTDTVTMAKLAAYTPTDQVMIGAKQLMTNIVTRNGDIALPELLAPIKEAIDYYGVIVNFGYNEDYDSRKIVGDNIADVYEKNYGNNDVTGPDALHGTHVAGIIAANRKNILGINGIADNVRIMPVRAIPNGDERDKDVANAIIYAVDNGAKIINMSFGKSYSPEKKAVDKAVQYAESKGVLLVHAAGNDGDNNDTEPNFPERYYLNKKEAKNWVEVGASSFGSGKDFVADFSNYGKKTVDLFAPGVEIFSTTPANHYQNESGTSMASPVTAGVAAILLEYFPELSAIEVKEILLKSTRKFDNIKVERPGDKKMVEFSQLSISGGMVNAYEAVKLAQQLKAQKKSAK